MILKSSLHLQNLVDDALDMSSIETGRFELTNNYFDARAALHEVCDVMHFYMEARRLKLTIFVHQDVPRLIKSDEKRFKQILYNLIGNAVKFTFTGGISVDVSYLI